MGTVSSRPNRGCSELSVTWDLQLYWTRRSAAVRNAEGRKVISDDVGLLERRVANKMLLSLVSKMSR